MWKTLSHVVRTKGKLVGWPSGEALVRKTS